MGYVLGRKPEHETLCFSFVKWLQPTMKGTSSVRRVRLRSFCVRIVPPMCFATSGCVCVRSSMRFLNLWLQIALELTKGSGYDGKWRGREVVRRGSGEEGKW